MEADRLRAVRVVPDPGALALGPVRGRRVVARSGNGRAALVSADARSRLVAGGVGAGLTHVCASDGPFMGGGLLLLSRFPFTATRFES